MWAESLASRCYRRFVARTMPEKGFKEIHIIDDKKSFVSNPLI
jgi:uncharacterized protein (DUF488 family)